MARSLLKSRKRRTLENENHERWFVSYADFITLLFAFFTVMFALSSVNEAKYRSMSEGISDAFSPGEPVKATGSELLAPPIEEVTEIFTDAFRKAFTNDYKKIHARLGQFENTDKLIINLEERGVVITLLDESTFASADANLLSDAGVLVDEIARTIKTLPNQIRIEGHTDDIPISTNKFPTNWHLSSARAISIVRYMVDTHGIDTARLSAIGYGMHRPIASNDTPEGRATNRRVDIVILNKRASLLEP